MPSIRLKSLLYSQWDSVAAPCAPGHLVPRIRQQPVAPPATGRHPPWSQAPAPILLPLLASHVGFQLSEDINPTPALPPHFMSSWERSSGDCHVLGEEDGAKVGCLRSWRIQAILAAVTSTGMLLLSGREECVPCSAPPKAW